MSCYIACLRRAFWGTRTTEVLYYLSIGGRPCNVTVFEATTGLTVLYPRKRRRPCCCRHRTRHLEPDRSSSKQQTRGIGRQCRFCTSWAGLLLSTIVNASIDITRDQTADSTDCVAWACCKRFKPGLYAGVRVCEVDSRPGAVLRPAHHNKLLLRFGPLVGFN